MEPLWYVTKDGDVSCLELYERHYSCYRYADGRKRSQFGLTIAEHQRRTIAVNRDDARATGMDVLKWYILQMGFDWDKPCS